MDVAISSSQNNNAFIGMNLGQVKRCVARLMNAESVAWSIKAWTTAIRQLIDQDKENEADSNDFGDDDYTGEDSGITSEKDLKNVIKDLVVTAAQDFVSQSQSFSQCQGQPDMDMDTETAVQDYEDASSSYNTSIVNNSSSPLRGARNADEEEDGNLFSATGSTATTADFENDDNSDPLTQEEEIFGTFDEVAGGSDDEPTQQQMEIDSGDEGDNNVERSVDSSDDDNDSGEGFSSSSDIDETRKENDNEEDYRSGEDDNSEFGSISKKNKKKKSLKTATLKKKSSAKAQSSMDSDDNSGDKKVDGDDDCDDDDGSTKSKSMDHSKEEKEKPKKKTSLDQEIDIVKKLENGPSEADLKRQAAIEIDEDDFSERMDQQRKLSMKNMMQSAGQDIRGQLRTLRECQSWLNERYNEDMHAKLIVDRLEKILKKENDGGRICALLIEYIENTQKFNSFMEVEETMHRNLNKDKEAFSNNIKPEPISAVKEENSLMHKSGGGDVVFLSDSDESDGDESDGDNESEVDEQSNSMAVSSSAKNNASVKQVAPPAMATMTMTEKIRADLLNKRNALEHKQQQLQIRQATVSPNKSKVDSSAVIHKSRSDLYSTLHEKARKDAFEYISRVKKVDTDGSSLEINIELCEKCRLFHELWQLKSDRHKERDNAEKERLRLEQMVAGLDSDDDEVEFGSEKKEKKKSQMATTLTKEDLQRILKENKEKARLKRLSRDNESDDDDDDDNADADDEEGEDEEGDDEDQDKNEGEKEQEESADGIRQDTEVADVVAAASMSNDMIEDSNNENVSKSNEMSMDMPQSSRHNASLDMKSSSAGGISQSLTSRSESLVDSRKLMAMVTNDASMAVTCNDDEDKESSAIGEDNVTIVKTYGRRRSSIPSRIIDQEDGDEEEEVAVGRRPVSEGSNDNAMSMDFEVGQASSINKNDHALVDDVRNSGTSSSGGDVFDLDAATSNSIAEMEASSRSNSGSKSEQYVKQTSNNSDISLDKNENGVDSSKDQVDNSEAPVLSSPNVKAAKREKEKKKEKEQDGGIKNAAYRLMLMQEEEGLRRKKRLAKETRGMLDEEADESEDEEKGIQYGLGEFGFSLAKKNDEDGDGEMKLRDDDLENIVDDVSEDEGDEEAGRQKRLEQERIDDERTTKAMIDNVTEGFRRKNKNKSSYDDDEKVLAFNDESQQKLNEPVQDFDEEEYFQERNKIAAQSKSQSQNLLGSDEEDDDDDDESDDEMNQDSQLTSVELEMKNQARLKKQERKRRERAERMRFEKNAQQTKALRQLNRQNSDRQNSQIGSNIMVVKAGSVFGSSGNDALDGSSSSSSSLGLDLSLSNLKRRTSKIPVKINSTNNLARRQKSAPALSNNSNSNSNSSINVTNSLLGQNSLLSMKAAANAVIAANRLQGSVGNGARNDSISRSGSDSQLLGMNESSNSGIGSGKGLHRVNSIVTDGLVNSASNGITPRITPSSNPLKRTNSFATDLMDSAMVRQFGGNQRGALNSNSNSNSGDVQSKRPRVQTPSAGSIQHSMFTTSENSNSNSQQGNGITLRNSSSANLSSMGGKENLGMQRSSSVSNISGSNSNGGSSVQAEKKSMSSMFNMPNGGQASSSGTVGNTLKRNGSTTAFK